MEVIDVIDGIYVCGFVSGITVKPVDGFFYEILIGWILQLSSDGFGWINFYIDSYKLYGIDIHLVMSLWQFEFSMLSVISLIIDINYYWYQYCWSLFNRLTLYVRHSLRIKHVDVWKTLLCQC